MELATATFDAIGVTNEIMVVDHAALDDALELARGFVAALDAACSRFRADSELVRLNETGDAVVSPILLDAVETAVDVASRTNGLVDPTVGSALAALGYDRDFDVVVRRGASPRFEVVPVSGWRSIRVDRASARVSLAHGTTLDLGATAKALAADAIARSVNRRLGVSTLVSLGGDIAVAGEAPEGGWPIRVADDHRRGSDTTAGQIVSIVAGGLATSSTTVRRWKAGRVELHHIVDPRTGASASAAWRSVSVAAGTCVDANAAATAAIVLGADAPSWLAAHGLPARLVGANRDVVRVAGWPA